VETRTAVDNSSHHGVNTGAASGGGKNGVAWTSSASTNNKYGSSSWAAWASAFLILDRHSLAQWPIVPQLCQVSQPAMSSRPSHEFEHPVSPLRPLL
jgi:hypothetical protein